MVADRATDLVLNSFSILGDLVQDLQNSDRFFKYKLLVLVLWLASAVGAFGVACPSSNPHNTVRARLITGGEPGAPIYMVKNESGEIWRNVEIVVNGRYRSTLSQLEPEGGLTISSAVVFDASGDRAPSTLEVRDLEVHVGDPEGSAVLVKEGAIQSE